MGSSVEYIDHGSTSTVKIMANIFISFIGAGVLGLPFAFKEAGVVEGSLIMISVGLISVKAMLLIVDCKYRLSQKDTKTKTTRERENSAGSAKIIIAEIPEDKETLLVENGLTPDSPVHKISIDISDKVKAKAEEPSIPLAPGKELTYGDIGYYAVGNPGRLLVEFSIVLTQTGFCCAYLVFICENLGDYIPSVKLHKWLLVILPPLVLMTFLRHLRHLAVFSLFAQFSNLMAFAVVFWFDLEHIEYVEYRIHPKQFSIKGLPFFLAVAIYCYEGAGMILSLESSVHSTIRSHFKWYFKLTMLIVTSLYVLFGVCGYLSFGPETNEIITLNLPKGTSLDFATMVKCCLCLALYCTYPVMMFPVMKILEKKLLHSPSESVWLGNILRLMMVSITGLIVMAVPNFANLMALVGASCCTLLAFILPGLFHYKIFSGSRTFFQGFQDISLIVIGLIGTIVGTWDALKRLQNGYEDTEESLSQLANATITQLINNGTAKS